MFQRNLGFLFTRRPLAIMAAILASTTISAPFAKADTFYWTNIGGNAIEKTDTVANTTSVVVSPSAPTPDSLIFDSTGSQIIYSSLFGGGVYEVGINGTGNHVIATGAQLNNSGFIQDLALEPGGTSVLVSTTDNGQLFRIDLTTNAVSLVGSVGSGLRGITYDNAGHLFAEVTGVGIYQLNPTNATVMNFEALPNGDGLTYDSFTGNLFVGSGNTVSEVSTALNTPVQTFTCGICGFIDGVEADGKGKIDLADTGGQIVQYDINANSFTALASTPGIDDLAPVSGLGSPNTVPEPSSLVLLLGAVPLILKYRRRTVS